MEILIESLDNLEYWKIVQFKNILCPRLFGSENFEFIQDKNSIKINLNFKIKDKDIIVKNLLETFSIMKVNSSLELMKKINELKKMI
jgi:hypothetical protein